MEDNHILKQINSYTILGKLADGGFTHVYLAQQNFPDGRTVAIKLLNSKALNSRASDLFLHEAQCLTELAKLKHPSILPILDYGKVNGIVYIVAEYTPRGNLRNRINSSVSVTIEEALTILRQIGGAVYAVHQQNIVHCDIKPENILFNDKNDAILADFGVAIRLNSDYELYELTRGTYAYMAPEQFEGKPSPASDQYSLGCVAYELFTGNHPFKYLGPFDPHNREIMEHRHKNDNPRPLREIKTDLPILIEQATLKAMAKRPQERHADVGMFIQSLETSTAPSASLQSSVSSPSTPQLSANSSTQQSSSITDAPKIIIPIPQGKNGSMNRIAEDTFLDPIKTLLDLRLSSEVINELTQPLKRLRLKLIDDVVHDEYTTSVRRRYTLVKNRLGQSRALLYIPKWLLDEATPSNINAISNVHAAFQEGSTLIIFSNTSNTPAWEIRRIMHEKWLRERQIRVILVPWRDVQDLKDMDQEGQNSWFKNALGLQELIKVTKKVLSVQQIDGNDTEVLVKIIAKLPQLTDESGRGWRTLLESAGLGEIIDEFELTGGSTRNIAFELVDKLKRRIRLLEKPDSDVIGLLLCYIITLDDQKITPTERDNIKRIIRKYQLVSSSRQL